MLPEMTTLTSPPTLVDNTPTLPALFMPHEPAAERFFDVFTATIRNKNTRRAYDTAACHFSEWCAVRGVHDLAGARPLHVAASIEKLNLAKPTAQAPSGRAASAL